MENLRWSQLFLLACLTSLYYKQVFSRTDSGFYCCLLNALVSQVITWSGKQQADVHAHNCLWFHWTTDIHTQLSHSRRIWSPPKYLSAPQREPSLSRSLHCTLSLSWRKRSKDKVSSRSCRVLLVFVQNGILESIPISQQRIAFYGRVLGDNEAISGLSLQDGFLQCFDLGARRSYTPLTSSSIFRSRLLHLSVKVRARRLICTGGY